MLFFPKNMDRIDAHMVHLPGIRAMPWGLLGAISRAIDPFITAIGSHNRIRTSSLLPFLRAVRAVSSILRASHGSVGARNGTRTDLTEREVRSREVKRWVVDHRSI